MHNQHSSKKSSLLNDERGGALIELAVVTPLLFTIAAGIMSLGFSFREHAVIVESMRNTARYAAGDLNENSKTNDAGALCDDYIDNLIVSLHKSGAGYDTINVKSDALELSPGNSQSLFTVTVHRDAASRKSRFLIGSSYFDTDVSTTFVAESKKNFNCERKL